jgi:taurine dioxygenase
MSSPRAPGVTFDLALLGSFGAEISGLDLHQPIDDRTAHHLRLALAEFQVLVFRGLSLSSAEQSRFTRCFGDLEPGLARRPESHRVPNHPEILYLSNKPGSQTSDYGMGWHSDGLAYARVPHGITMLHCIACPQNSGGTKFANQYAAYAAMPEQVRASLHGLYWYLPSIPFSEVPPGKQLAQPIVRTHPTTGRNFLFCAPAARRIRGMTDSESERILALVREYQWREGLVYHHAWRERDVVVWENCALLHSRADVVDFETQGLRAMHRSATVGSFAAIECEDG